MSDYSSEGANEPKKVVIEWLVVREWPPMARVGEREGRGLRINSCEVELGDRAQRVHVRLRPYASFIRGDGTNKTRRAGNRRRRKVVFAYLVF